MKLNANKNFILQRFRLDFKGNNCPLLPFCLLYPLYFNKEVYKSLEIWDLDYFLFVAFLNVKYPLASIYNFLTLSL